MLTRSGMVVWAGCLALGMVGGCALTGSEKEAIIAAASERAGKEAADLAYKKAIEHGMSEEDSLKVAELARAEASRVAGEIARKNIPEVEEEKRSGLEKILATVLMLIANVGLGLGRKTA